MGFKPCVAKFVRYLLDTLCSLYGLFFQFSKSKRLQPVEDGVLLLPAVVLAARIRQGKLKSVDVVKAYFKRIETTNKLTNAAIEVRHEAIEEADLVDRKVEAERAGEHFPHWMPDVSIQDLPLLGVPFSCKDSIAIRGMPLTIGLYVRKDHVAAYDAQVVKNLRNAGAIPIAVTNVPELNFWWDSNNTIYGRTNNPYDLSLIPGGSSGGEGALISSAASIIGVGSDIAGSIRLPAYFCGIFGHKTTPCIVSTEGKYPQSTPEKEKLFSIGPLCRYASDLLPTLKAMTGESIRNLPKIDKPVDFSKLKIFYMLDDGDPRKSPVNREIKKSILKVVKHFENTYNTSCVNVNLRRMQLGLDMWEHAFAQANGPPVSVAMTDGNGELDVFNELLKSAVGMSRHTKPILVVALSSKLTSTQESKSKDYLFCELQKLKRQLESLLEDNGVFLFPTYPEVGVKHRTTLLKIWNIGYTAVFNVVGLPATQCPLGLNRKGLPLGVQVAAAPHHDHLTIGVAQEIEKAFGGWMSPSAFNLKYNVKVANGVQS